MAKNAFTHRKNRIIGRELLQEKSKLWTITATYLIHSSCNFLRAHQHSCDVTSGIFPGHCPNLSTFSVIFDDCVLVKGKARVTFNSCFYYTNFFSVQQAPVNWSSACLLHNSNAEATFTQSTTMQRFLKIILTLSCWYSLDGSCWVLSYEYPYVKVLCMANVTYGQYYCIYIYILYWLYSWYKRWTFTHFVLLTK